MADHAPAPSDPAPPDVAPPTRGVRVSPRLTIPSAELQLSATRSSGAGGQHVNKTASRVELVWNVRDSHVLTEAQRARLLSRLAGRLAGDGALRLVASDTRSQHRNRALVEARLAELIREALVVPKARKATAPSRAARQARLDAKRRQGEKKQRRRHPSDE